MSISRRDLLKAASACPIIAVISSGRASAAPKAATEGKRLVESARTNGETFMCGESRHCPSLKDINDVLRQNALNPPGCCGPAECDINGDG